jgi:hypothetical protein
MRRDEEDHRENLKDKKKSMECPKKVRRRPIGTNERDGREEDGEFEGYFYLGRVFSGRIRA